MATPTMPPWFEQTAALFKAWMDPKANPFQAWMEGLKSQGARSTEAPLLWISTCGASGVTSAVRC